MHQSIPAAPSKILLCAGSGICQPQDYHRTFNTHAISNSYLNVTMQRILLEKKQGGGGGGWAGHSWNWLMHKQVRGIKTKKAFSKASCTKPHKVECTLLATTTYSKTNRTILSQSNTVNYVILSRDFSNIRIIHIN